MKQREMEYLSPHGRHHEVSCVVAIINESAKQTMIMSAIMSRSDRRYPNTQLRAFDRSFGGWRELEVRSIGSVSVGTHDMEASATLTRGRSKSSFNRRLSS